MFNRPVVEITQSISARRSFRLLTFTFCFLSKMKSSSSPSVFTTMVVKISTLAFVFLMDGTGKLTSASASSSTQQAEYQVEDQFCFPNVKVPFYQRDSDGAVCCGGKELPVVSLPPEVTGSCAISTKTGTDGLLNSQNLWCSYTCSLKKLGAIDAQGNTVPEKFFQHLTKGLTDASKTRLKTIMDKYLGCFKPMKNSASPCQTPLSFHKCFQDALVFLCTVGVPKNNDFSAFPKVKADYKKVEPFCYFNNRKLMPGCCHGKPMPWTVTEILESDRNETGYNSCMKEMGDECDATCLLRSSGVVNDDFELDVEKFSKKILKHFPTVKPSAWMDFTGPVFLFYDEVLADMGDEATSPTQRVCRFHDRVMELHESKVDQYCSMSAEEVKELVKASKA